MKQKILFDLLRGAEIGFRSLTVALKLPFACAEYAAKLLPVPNGIAL